MAHPPDYYMKLHVGELVAQLAVASAEIERLQEELAARPLLEDRRTDEAPHWRTSSEARDPSSA